MQRRRLGRGIRLLRKSRGEKVERFEMESPREQDIFEAATQFPVLCIAAAVGSSGLIVLVGVQLNLPLSISRLRKRTTMAQTAQVAWKPRSSRRRGRSGTGHGHGTRRLTWGTRDCVCGSWSAPSMTVGLFVYRNFVCCVLGWPTTLRALVSRYGAAKSHRSYRPTAKGAGRSTARHARKLRFQGLMIGSRWFHGTLPVCSVLVPSPGNQREPSIPMPHI